MKTLLDLSERDITRIKEGAQHYGPSWKQRGGAGAYMVGIRKWDRIAHRLREGSWGAVIAADRRAEGIMDDIRDLRCYLLMMLAEHATFGSEHWRTSLAYVDGVPEAISRCLAERIPSEFIPERAMAEVETIVEIFGWDVFRALEVNAGLRPKLQQMVAFLYEVDLVHGEDVPDVLKGDRADLVTLYLLRNGERLLFPGEIFNAGLNTVRKALTLEGDEVMLATDAVAAAVRLPRTRIIAE
jgi:hypothetical protein